MYLTSFNYFRGIAIVFIVAGHCLYRSGWTVDSPAERMFANLIVGGTALFVFISGFLFHHIYSARFGYGRFMAAKTKNVLMPYLVLSLPLVLYSVLVRGSGPFAEYFFDQKPGVYHAVIRPAALYLWSGRILDAYWYIPFIMTVFALSPLIMYFIALRPVPRLAIVVLLCGASLVVQRPVLNISVAQSVVYFLPVYLFGIIASIHRQKIYACLDGKEGFLLVLIILLAAVQAYWYPGFGNLHKPPLRIGLPDILLVQKIILCLFFMVLLKRFEKIRIPLLDILASASFAVFFLHPYLLLGLQLVLNRQHPLLVSIQGPLLWLIMTPSVILFSIGLALAARRLAGAHSRLLIGW